MSCLGCRRDEAITRNVSIPNSPCISGAQEEPGSSLPGFRPFPRGCPRRPRRRAASLPQDTHFPDRCPAVLPLPQVCSAQRTGPRATDRLSPVPRRPPPNLSSTWRDPRGPDRPKPEKCKALFLIAPKIARGCCTSLLIIPPASAVNQGEDAPPPEPLSAAALSARAMPAAAAGCRVRAAGGRGAAAAQRGRKRSRGGGGGSFPFPQPWLRGRMLTVPAALDHICQDYSRDGERENLGG